MLAGISYQHAIAMPVHFARALLYGADDSDDERPNNTHPTFDPPPVRDMPHHTPPPAQHISENTMIATRRGDTTE